MKILLFSQNAWDETNSFGNTVSNFFDGWEDDVFSHFYIRRQLPANGVAENYYCLPVGTVIKKLLGKNKEKCAFKKDEIPEISKRLQKDIESEKEQIQKIHRKSNNLMHSVYESLWMSKIWLDKEFKQFISENEPDVFFAFAANAFILYPLIAYLKKHTHAKIVLFIADDVYGNYEKCPFIRGARLRKCYKKCIMSADMIYAISDGMKNRYVSLFGRDIKILRKGCDLSLPISENVNTPLRIVYAGNLLYGRTEILAKFAQTLEKLNRDSTVAVLEIYSPTVLEEKERILVERKGSSVLMGTRSYAEIKKIQNQADLILHVESFEKEQIDAVKYSFSTKIIDCIQSGSAVLAVGPSVSSSMKYLRNIDGVNVIENVDSLEEYLTELIERKDELPKQAERIRNYAERAHDINAVRQSLRDDFLQIADV